MARIPMLDEDDQATPPEARFFLVSTWDNVTRGDLQLDPAFGKPSPPCRQALEFIRSLRKDGGLTRSQTEFVWTTSAVVNGCHY